MIHTKKTLILCTVIFMSLQVKSRAQDASLPSDSLITAKPAFSLPQQWLQRLPFRGDVNEYYKLLPGISVQDYRGTEYLHVRGSRHDEISYAFEGADVRSAFTGFNLFHFIPEALESIQVVAAPNAVDGHAAALLEHRMRRGGPGLKFTLHGESDRFTPHYQKRLGTNSYGYFDLALTAEGRIGKDNLGFLIAAERQSYSDHYRMFWDGFTFSQPAAIDPRSNNTLRELIGEDEIVVLPGNIPHAESGRYTLNSIVTADLGDFNLRAIGLYNRTKQQLNDTPIQNLFNPLRIPETKQQASLISFQMDYRNPKFEEAHLQIDHLTSTAKTYDPLFEDNFLLYRDSLAVVEKGVPWESTYFGDDSYFDGPGDFNYFAFPFSRPGDLIADYEKWQDNALSISGRLRKKFGAHEITIGGNWQRRTLRRFEINRLLSFMRRLKEIENDPERFSPTQQDLLLRERGEVYALGYDILGKKIDTSDDVNDAPSHPRTISFFIDDQFNSDNLQIDLGLRYDIFSTDALIPEDPTNPQFNFSRYSNLPLSSMKRAPTRGVVSPRFQATFSTNDRLRFHFSFGKYAQQPQFRNVHAGRGYWVWAIERAGGYNLQPRGAHAEPIRTTQSTFRISYDASPSLHLVTTLFHKSADGHLQVDRIQASEESFAGRYLILGNSGESVAKGAEFSLSYVKQGLRAHVNYTYSELHGFHAYPLANLGNYLYDFSNEETTDTGPYVPLESHQRHQGNILLSYAFSENAPAWLRNTGIHTLFRFNSGHPYTLREAGETIG